MTPKCILNIIDGFVDLFDKRRCRDGSKLILLCDGGISSQIYQYVWGQMLIDAGFDVVYDLTFFRKYGRDALGRKNRFFLLNNLCDLKRFVVAPEYEARHYKFRYLNMENQPPNSDWMYIEHDWHPPLYLGNYYKCNPNFFVQNIKKYVCFKKPEEVLNKNNLVIFTRISQGESVGIHVRRGDMAKNTNRWKVPRIEYFLKAVSIEELQGKDYYFFSDDIKWLKENIITRLPINTSYTIVDSGDKEAHQDLYLLSKCKYQVASQGSFGVLAFVMNENTNKMLVYPAESRTENLDRLKGENVIVLDMEGNRVK